ncbi:MAG: glutamine synthetase, partial [Actinomycetota bacterium]|nr:glutamine synthetase [Actinomycetota bacterium]
MARPEPLTPAIVRQEVASGLIDTVSVAITDMQGRLQGKRIDADYFVEEVMDG